MAAILSLVAAASFGIGDFLGGVGSRQIPARAVAAITSLAGLIVSLPILIVVGGSWTSGAVVYGAAAGLLGALGLVMLFIGLGKGPFQLVSPISAVIGGLVPVIFGIASGERPGTLAVIGLVTAPPAVWILAGGSTSFPTSIERMPLLAAAAAGVAFGFFFVCFDATPDGSGFVPVVVAKIAAVIALWSWNLTVGFDRPGLRAIQIAAVSGVFDMLANGIFLAASNRGDLSQVGALVSLYPGVNALLAAVVLGERLRPLQLVGFALAMVAGLLLAV